MIRSQFNYRTVGRLTHRAFYCFPDPPFRLLFHLCSPRCTVSCTVPMCVAPPVCLVSLFTKLVGTLCVDSTDPFSRKQGHLTVCTEGHRVPYWDLGHHLESRVRARCRVVASSGLAIADFPVINSSCAAALLQNDAGPAGFRNLMVRGRVKMPAAAVRA